MSQRVYRLQFIIGCRKKCSGKESVKIKVAPFVLKNIRKDKS